MTAANIAPGDRASKEARAFSGPRDPTARDVRTPEGRVRIERRGGGGRPVLLLHGLSANRRCWDPVARRLEDAFDLCLPDLPGRGESEPRPDLAHDLEKEVDRLRRVLASLPFAPEIAVGHSHGAALALALAAVDPRIAGLVLVNPVHPGTRRPAVLELLRAEPVRRVLAPALVPLRRPLARCILRRVYGGGGPPGPDAVERYAAPYADPARVRLLLRVLADWEPGALESRLPTRPLVGWVLGGGRDRRIGLRGPGRLAGRLGFEFAALPAAGHAVPEEAPEAVVRAVRAVASALEAGGDAPGGEERRSAR